MRALSLIARRAVRFTSLLMVCASGGSAAVGASSVTERVNKPLPIEVIALQRSHATRVPVDVSADGMWIAHTYQTADGLSGFVYSKTGVPGTDGLKRMQADLVNIRSREVVHLGTPDSSSWAAVWSPDARRVAYYSDQDGEAGLWIWDRETGRSMRFPGVIVRPYFGFETVHWMSDSERLVCQILPAGVTMAAANAEIPNPKDQDQLHFQNAGPTAPSVLVLQAPDAESNAEATAYGTIKSIDRSHISDLAVLNVRTHDMTRIARGVNTRWAAFSPDDRYLAYTSYNWMNGAMSYRLSLYGLSGGVTRTLADNFVLTAGDEISWSPDSSSLAYHTTSQIAADPKSPRGHGRIDVVSIGGASMTFVAGPNADFGAGYYHAPLWDARGENIYEASGGQLWRFNLQSGEAKTSVQIPGRDVVLLVQQRDNRSIFHGAEGPTLWVLARDRTTQRFGLYSVNEKSGLNRLEFETEQALPARFNLEGSAASHNIFFTASDQQHGTDVWAFDVLTRRSRQISHINDDMDRYLLGTAHIIKWRGIEGQALEGALMLPPEYRLGHSLPLVVWIYGAENGAEAVNSFGFSDAPVFNMQVLATRGYAVLYPNAPLREGSPMKDLLNAVMPGVNAVIDQGYADPGRLAIMGQSFGSYSTLALIVQTQRFKAAVITGAMLHPDLFADYLLNPVGPDGTNIYYEKGLGDMGGSPWEYRGRYNDNSPLFLFDQIQTPVLIAQGELDTPLSASRAIFYALRRLGKKAEYRIYEGEEHVIDRTPDVIDLWKRRLEFLSENLDLDLDADGRVVFNGNTIAARRAARQ